MDTKKIVAVIRKMGPAKLGLLVAAGICLLFLFREDSGAGKGVTDSEDKFFIEEESEHVSREEKLKRVLEQTEGVGNTEVIITTNDENVAEGVVVVCEGGDSARVQKKIIDSVQVLFPLSSHKIKVMKMKSKG